MPQVLKSQQRANLGHCGKEGEMGKGRRTDEYVFKRNNALVDILSCHKGEHNSIGSKEISEQLKDLGYDLDRASVHQTIAKIKFERTIPICFSNKGYWWASSRSEIVKSIENLESRRKALKENIELLRKFVID